MPPVSLSITPRGPFSLAEAATFGFGQRQDEGFDGVMRLAFCLDGYEGHAGVEIRQDSAPAGAAQCTAPLRPPVR